MKFKKVLKLFSLTAFLALSCCISAFAERETFKLKEKEVATYEFVDDPDTQKINGKALMVYRYVKDPYQDDKPMNEFAKLIRKKCKDEKINLRVVMTKDLTYVLDENMDKLTIGKTPKTEDWVIKKWALRALNCIKEETADSWGKSDPITLLVPTTQGLQVKHVREEYVTYTPWGVHLRNVIVEDPRIKPRTIYDLRGLTKTSGINVASEAKGWHYLFYGSERCSCDHVVINGQSIEPYRILAVLG